MGCSIFGCNGAGQFIAILKCPKHRKFTQIISNKGRGIYRDSEEVNRSFSLAKCAAVGRILLSWLSKADDLTIVTIAIPHKPSPLTYAAFMEWLDGWAERNLTTAMIFYDGKQGNDCVDDGRSPEEIRIQWDSAFRSSAPYRNTHRSLNLQTSRVIEDVVMLDSKNNQLIEASWV